jgi:hypothetical protein
MAAYPPDLMRHLWSRTPQRVLVAAAALALTAASCNGGGGTADPPTTTTNTPPATTTPPTTAPPRTTNKLLTDVDAVLTIDGNRGYTPDQQQIVRAYVRAEQANIKAHLSPVDPQDVELAATTTGAHYQRLVGVFSEDKAAGKAMTDPKILTIRVGKVQQDAPNRFLVEACYVSDSHLYQVSSGQLLEHELPDAARLVNAMEMVDGAWKLAQQGQITTWNGSPLCLEPLS